MARSKRAQAAVEEALAAQITDAHVGLGVDIVEVARMRAILKRTPSFARRVFSEEERAYCESHADPAMHFAARFAAKEAVLKALGTGFSHGIGLRDVEVARVEGGKPQVVLKGAAAHRAQELDVVEIPLSLSHTATDAIACAIAIPSDSRLAKPPRVDAACELSRQFKEARSMLDSLPNTTAAVAAADVVVSHHEEEERGDETLFS